jgi:hypothetical protein
MRLAVFGLSVALMMSAAAYAQPDRAPRVITPEDTINLAVGQSTKLEFPGVFDQVNLTSDVVQVKPISDRVMTLQGLAEGSAIMTVMSGSKEVYSVSIVVGAELGHTVKFYDGRSKDYTGYYCTDVNCGRADKELNGARDVSSTTVVTPGGTAITRTYGAPSK